jgi:protein required for attachment to host cells
MKATWIVVADAYRARFFATDDPADPLFEIETLSNPGARLHEGDLVSDRGGRDLGPAGSSHGLDDGAKAKDETANRFAGMICEHLERGRQQGAFERLYVVGAPAFLGLLRKHQSNELRGLVTDEIAKDLTTQTAKAIRDRLPANL